MMRALALFLIVVNLAYLGWATLIDAPPERPRSTPAADDNVERLVLARERDVAVATAAALAKKVHADKPAASSDTATSTNNPPAATAGATGPQCISIGPFEDLASAAQASATLKSQGHDSHQRLEQGQLWVGYWVNIPGFAKREDAETAVARLKENGFSDAYISLNGTDADASNIISLGVFKEVERAHRLLDEAKALGFAAQISDRTREGSVFWIDTTFQQPDPNFDLAALGARPGKIVRLEQRPCTSDSHVGG